MDHADHLRLLRDGVPNARGTWADLGAGDGAFTLALADLLGAGSTIHAVDRDAGALRELEAAYARLATRRPLAAVTTLVADFTHDLALPTLDGIVMANSLHFVRDKGPVLARAHDMLRTGGVLLLVEYDTDRGNTWVPYPLSFETWQTLAAANGFSTPRLVGRHPSRFLRAIFSAASERSDDARAR